MKQKITKRGLFAIAAKTIDEKRPEVIALMQRYGMAVNLGDSNDKVDAAFMALLRKSRGFRKDFAALSVESAQKIQKEYSNATGMFNASGHLSMGGDDNNYMNLFGFGKKKKSTSKPTYEGKTTTVPTKEDSSSTTTTKTPFYPTPSGSAPTSSGSTTTTSTGSEGEGSAETKQPTKFGEWIKGVFTPDTTQNIINTGLGIWAYQKTGGAGITPIQQGRYDYNPTAGNTTGGGNNGGDGGLGVGAIVGISLVGLALVGGVIYAVTKK
jgi:hypothetical protein